MSNHSQKPAETPDHTIITRHRSQATTQPSQANKNVSQSTVSSSIQLLKTKKQRAKERGRQLQKLIQEKRARGEIKKSQKPRRTKSQKAGIFFPVNKFHKKLKKQNPKCLVPALSAVLISAVIEYLTAEVLELAGNVSSELKRHRIIPRHIFLAIKNDSELELLLKHAVFTQSGVLPGIHPSLLNTKSSNKIKKTTTESAPDDHNETGHSSQSNHEEARAEPSPNKRKHDADEEETPTQEHQQEIDTQKSNKKPSPAKRVKH